MSGTLVDSAKLAEAKTKFDFLFQQGATKKPENGITSLATYANSTGDKSKYPLVGALKRFSKWVGERVYQDFARYAYELKNVTFDNSVEIGLDAFADDQYDGYSMLFSALGEQAAFWPQDLLVDALIAGETEKCWDDQPFFSANHKLEPSDQSNTVFPNLFTGSALSASTFQAVRASMRKVGVGTTSRDNRSVGFGTNLVLACGPDLQATAESIVDAQYLAGGATNVNYKKASILILNELGSSTDWYLAEVGKALKPLLFQTRQAPNLVAPSPNDASVKEKRLLRWMGDARGAAGYTLPHLMAKAKA